MPKVVKSLDFDEVICFDQRASTSSGVKMLRTSLRATLAALLLFIFTTASSFEAEQLHPMFWLNGGQQLRTTALTPMVLEMAVHAPDDDSDHEMPGMPGMDSEWLNDFVPMHMKYMHLVLIKKDLSHIAHVHPFYDPGSGLFSIPLNLQSKHPDNFATLDAIPTSGEYAVFAEAKSLAYGMVTFRTDLKSTEGNGRMPKSWRKPLVLDPVTASGAIRKCLDEACTQEVQLRYDEVEGCGGNLVRFFVAVNRKDETGNFVSDEKLQPWMMMGAHAILARDSGQMTKEDYSHLHAQMPDEGTPAVLALSIFNRGKLTDSNYRMWVQFKSDGKINTVPFTFRYQPMPVDDSCGQ